jgi:hypothetical protein
MKVVFNMLFASDGWKSDFNLLVENVTPEQIEQFKTQRQSFGNGWYSEYFGDMTEELAKALGYDDMDELEDIHDERTDGWRIAPTIEDTTIVEDEDTSLDIDRTSPLGLLEFLKVMSEHA